MTLPIQTSYSEAPTRSVFWRATQFQQNEYTPEVLSVSFDSVNHNIVDTFFLRESGWKK